jgi:toxin YhaV
MEGSWKLFYFKPFQERYKQLALDVLALSKKNPDTYKTHKKTKFLAQINSVIKNKILTNPNDKEFNLGNTLPKEYSFYKRAKAGLPARYRLFFRFRSDQTKIIIIWMNDEFSLRKAGSKTDAYTIFTSMLKSRTIPNEWNSLLKKSKAQ